ncbi:hypothetical protein ACTXT7_007776 [Hymenolepis weldensis]
MFNFGKQLTSNNTAEIMRNSVNTERRRQAINETEKKGRRWLEEFIETGEKAQVARETCVSSKMWDGVYVY